MILCYTFFCLNQWQESTNMNNNIFFCGAAIVYFIYFECCRTKNLKLFKQVNKNNNIQ